MIQRGDVDERAGQHLADLSVLYEVGRAISSTLDLDQVLELLGRLAAKALRARTAILRMAEGDAGELRLTSRFDAEGAPDVAGVDALLAERVRREAAPALIPDIGREARLADHAGSVTGSATWPTGTGWRRYFPSPMTGATGSHLIMRASIETKPSPTP